VLKLPNKQLPQDLLAREDLGIRENEKKKEVNTSTVPAKNSEMGRDPDLAILTLVGRRSFPGVSDLEFIEEEGDGGERWRQTSGGRTPRGREKNDEAKLDEEESLSTAGRLRRTSPERVNLATGGGAGALGTESAGSLQMAKMEMQ
jgi:hypothetical protein